VRVLIAIPSLARAGAERVAVDEAVELTRRGHLVTVVSAGGALEAELASAGVAFERSRTRLPDPFGFGKTVWELARVARASRAQVVHAHSVLWSAALRCGRALGLHRAALAVTIHGFNRPWAARAASIVGGGLDALFSVSAANRARVIAAGLGAHRVRLLRNAVRPPSTVPWPAARRAEAREALGLPASGVVVCVVARLVGLKGHRTLIAAIPRVRARFPDTTFLFVGDGRERRRLERTADRVAPGSVRFLPATEAMDSVYAATDLIVLPSFREAFPMVLLEAARHAVPVVATRVGDVPHIVVEGATGLLVPPGDTVALADAICRALADPDGLRRMGTSARARVADEFQLTARIDVLERELVRASNLARR